MKNIISKAKRGSNSLAFVLCGALSIVIQSCSKDDFIPDDLKDPVWTPELAIPLAYTEIGINDLAHIDDTSTVVVIDPDQFCTLLYSGRIFEMDGRQLIQVSDQSASQSFQLNNNQAITINNGSQVLITGNQQVVFSLSQGVEIDSMALSFGQLEVEFTSQVPANAEVRITIPGLQLAGMIFSELVPLNYSGTLPVSVVRQIPIGGYTMDLTRGGTTHNTLVIQYAVTFQSAGSPVSSNQALSIESRLQSMDYSMVYGYAGQQFIQSPADSIPVSIFKNAGGTGSFNVVNPTITVAISNSIGIPFSARVPSLAGLNQHMTNLTVCTGIPDPIPLMSPVLSQAGQVIHSGFDLTGNNSNIQTLIQNQPACLIAVTQLATNPAGQNLNFIPGNGRLAMDMTLSLPLHGSASDFRIRDTLPFTYNDLDQVESMTIRLGVENWFPLEARAQIIFIDENLNPLDSIFMPGTVLIPSGRIPVNQERVSVPGIGITDETLDPSTLEKISGATRIIVEAVANTAGNGTSDVKIYHDYRMKFTVGARVKLNVQ